MERPAAAGHADSGYSAIGLLSTRTSSAHPLRTRTSSSATSTSRPSTTPVPSARRRPRSRSMSMPQSRLPCSSWVIASPPPWIQVRSDGCLERPARLAGSTGRRQNVKGKIAGGNAQIYAIPVTSNTGGQVDEFPMEAHLNDVAPAVARNAQVKPKVANGPALSKGDETGLRPPPGQRTAIA